METNEKITVIDASGLILGRMCSAIAKRLLNGENIVVVNAEKAVISGKKRSKIQEIKKFLEVGHPGHGPFHPRRPDMIVRRTVRGMLPWKQPKGKQAYKRLRVYIGTPEAFNEKPKETIKFANAQRLRCPYFTIGELAREIGWKPRGV